MDPVQKKKETTADRKQPWKKYWKPESQAKPGYRFENGDGDGEGPSTKGN